MIGLILYRTYYGSGTNGVLTCGGKKICATIERAWQNNQKRISCIPEGTYRLRKRHSRKFGWHLEILGVKGRSLILFHPANNAAVELNGCIAPVTEIAGEGLGKFSRKAFVKLKDLVYAALSKNEEVHLTIKSGKS